MSGFFEILPIEKEKSTRKLIVHFSSKEDIQEFSKLINQSITLKTQSIWYPSSIKSQLPVETPKSLFDLEKQENNSKEIWDEYWKGMPEYTSKNIFSIKAILIFFKSDDDVVLLSKLVNQKIGKKTLGIWYPKAKIVSLADKRYLQIKGKQINPKYPVYIISKGRWESRQTSKALEAMKIPYRIVIEEQEYDQYSAIIDPEKILVLPFSNLGQGSIPARNWVWEHSISEGHKRHWILDDNIKGFLRCNYNQQLPAMSGSIFKAIEDFTDRYKNVAISGMHYFMFVRRKDKNTPITFNHRVYSNLLIKNDIKQRWRGRYNEDTDFCLQVLKDGLCTLLFKAFLAWKTPTMTMKGGNTEDLYEVEDGRLKMAKSLQEQHPDIVRISRKWGRYQHHVDYSKFKFNKLKLKEGIKIPKGINNYGMVLQQLVNGKWIEKELNGEKRIN